MGAGRSLTAGLASPRARPRFALDPMDSPAGVGTPAATMGEALVARLRAIGFTLEVRRR